MHVAPARPFPLAPAAGALARRSGLSIVVPCYNEAQNLPALHGKLCAMAAALAASDGLQVEVVYVDDGSRDETLAVARNLPATGLDVQVVSFSRNFGKEAALLAGLEHAQLGAVLFMDGDGQHTAELASRLVRHWLDDGHDIVYTAKAHRDDEGALKRLFTTTFYRLLNWGARQPIPADAGDFRLLSPRAAEALRRLPERSRFFKGLSSWIGFRQHRVEYEPEKRAHGRSTFNFFSLLALSIEGLTSFSVAPLRVASLFGFLLAATALFYGAIIVGQWLIFGHAIPGYPSVIVGIMVIGGVQLVMIGVMGEYIGKILSELKARPVYFVAEHEVRPAATATAPASRSAAE